MSRDILDLTITTQEELLHLMKIGDIWIERSGKNAFFVAVERQSGRIVPVNQKLARAVIHHPLVVTQRWREGWGEAKPTEITRWIIDGAIDD